MEAAASLDDILRQDRIRINMTVPTEPMSLKAYVEDCRMKVFEHAFLSHFRGSDAFNKTNDFKEYKGSELLVRRTVFRYFPYHVIAGHFISYSILVPVLPRSDSDELYKLWCLI